MNAFTVSLLDPATLTPIMVNPRLELRPDRYSATDRGGYDRATIAVSGPEQAVQEALRWLRYGVEIINPLGSTVWAGYVHEVELVFGGMRYTLSLDEMANKVAVLYSYEDVDGVQTAGTTTWAEHEASQARYGVKEMIVSAADLEETAAEARRDVELAQRQYPTADGEPERGEPEATLHCRGWTHTLDWLYYSNEYGREEHTTSDAEQPLGLGFTSADVGFTKWDVHAHGGQLLNFPTGQKVVISGADEASNNGTKLLDDGSSGDAVTYTATTIRFEPDDDIIDSAAGLKLFRKGEMILVDGSDSNDGWHVLDGEGAQHMTTYTGWMTTDIANEAAGDTVTISHGNSVRVATAGVNESPDDNASVTITCYGVKVAQSFENSSDAAWSAARIGIQVQAVGSPSDDLTVKLCSNSSGSPGTALATGTIAATDIGTEMLWRWAELSTTVSLATSTTYWITVERGGSNDWDDFYQVGVDETASYALGSMKVYDGSAWQTRPTAADMSFKVWGEVATTTQIETMADEGEFVRDIVIEDASGINSNQYRDGTKTLLQEIVDLLDMGTSAGKRFAMVATADRTLRVWEEPDEYDAPAVWRANGTLAARMGGAWEQGRLLVGHYMEIEVVPPAINSLAPFSPRYVSECEYDVASDTTTPTFVGRRRALDLGVRPG